MLEQLRKELNKKIVGNYRQSEYFCSAVCLPLIKTEDGLSILFEVRSQNLKHQPGELCFPGGRIEELDLNNPQMAAVRETIEELQIVPEQLNVLGCLDITITPTGTLIYPFVGILTGYQSNSFSSDEVERVIEIPLQFFLNNQPVKADLEVRVNPTDNFPLDLIPQSYMKKWDSSSFMYPTYFYKLPDGSILWGITARILLDFLDVYKRLIEQ